MSWSSEQLANANAIIRVGQSVGASQRDIVVALAAAMQESGLRNLNYGDRDSIGLFQQRNAWGSTADRLNPETAAKMFFLGGHGGQRGLFAFKNRNSMSVAQAAQAVQVSAFPDAYAKWESQAKALAGNPKLPTGPAAGGGVTTTTQKVPMSGLDALLQQQPQDQQQADPSALGEVTANSMGLGEVNLDSTLTNQLAPENPMASLHAPVPAAGAQMDPTLGLAAPGGGANKVIGFARKFLGVPYIWGGTSPTGFDCSGLVQYVYRHAGVNLPRLAADQARSGKRIGLNELKPGDLVAWDNNSQQAGADHIALYIGNGQIIEAPRPGRSVQVSGLYDTGQAWGVRLNHG